MKKKKTKPEREERQTRERERTREFAIVIGVVTLGNFIGYPWG